MMLLALHIHGSFAEVSRMPRLRKMMLLALQIHGSFAEGLVSCCLATLYHNADDTRRTP